jgi:hypothetical protein
MSTLPGITVRGLEPRPTSIGNDITMAIDSNPDALTGPATRLRASDSLVCARRLGFRLFGTPPDIVDDWSPEARAKGQAVDRLVKDVLVRRHSARADVHFDFLPDVPLEGIGDAIYPLDEGLVAVEVKSTTTKKLMGVLGNWRSTPAGPEASWVCQAALLALAVGAELVHIIVVASDDNDNRHPPAEWVIGLDDDLVHLPIAGTGPEGVTAETARRLATRELRRQHNILNVVTAGTLPRREIPGYGLVLYPPSRSQEGADPWTCRFCPYQPSCSALGADERPGFAEAS